MRLEVKKNSDQWLNVEKNGGQWLLKKKKKTVMISAWMLGRMAISERVLEMLVIGHDVKNQ